MADPGIRWSTGLRGEVTVNAGTTTFLAGDLVAYNGANWVLADADTPSSYARWICGASVAAGQGTTTHALPVYKEVLIEDTDAPYTVGDVYYLSATAGKWTATRPATAGQLIQVVGQALTTSLLHLKLGNLVEREAFFVPNIGSSAGVRNDTLWGGADFAATDGTDFGTVTGFFPSNMVSLGAALALVISDGATTAMDVDFTFSRSQIVTSATGSGVSNVQDAGLTITAADVLGTPPADNIVERFNLITGFDADFLSPGSVWTVHADPDGLGGGTNNCFIGVYVRYNCIEPGM